MNEYMCFILCIRARKGRDWLGADNEKLHRACPILEFLNYPTNSMNGRPSFSVQAGRPDWRDYDVEKDFEEAEAVIDRFEADIEEQYGLLEERYGERHVYAGNECYEVERESVRPVFSFEKGYGMRFSF
jgi:hypothetical protein